MFASLVSSQSSGNLSKVSSLTQHRKDMCILFVSIAALSSLLPGNWKEYLVLRAAKKELGTQSRSFRGTLYVMM